MRVARVVHNSIADRSGNSVLNVVYYEEQQLDEPRILLLVLANEGVSFS